MNELILSSADKGLHGQQWAGRIVHRWHRRAEIS
ncbi:hypothetical protein V202x_24400 [Gimesia aquarii]|uniref:Uncharacterized protein n=1 Tax=Gimesia aquarii TaxID=2527964 RepID=A0A517WUX1_9PLAN|nr:hypothetical protein V202x_24400 [Gimesia aquarii]